MACEHSVSTRVGTKQRATSHHSSLAVLAPKLLPCQTATCPYRELLLACIQLSGHAGELGAAAGATRGARTSPGFCVLYISRYEDRDSAPVAPPSPPPPRRRKHAWLARGARRSSSASLPRLRWLAKSSAASRRSSWSAICRFDARRSGKRKRAAESTRARAGGRRRAANPMCEAA